MTRTIDPEESRPAHRVPMQEPGLSPRWAAVLAGLGYLLTPTPFAEFYVYPRLVVQGHPGQTIHNIMAHQELFAAGVLAYLLSFVCDVVIAWALYYLFRPVSAPLARLAAWFQLVYAAVGLTGALNLATVLRLVRSPADTALFADPGALSAQVRVLLMGFGSIWGLSLVLFGIHLLLVGTLILRSNYVSKWVGLAVGLAGAGYIVQNVNAYLFPAPDLGYVWMALLGELVLVGWLLIRGWSLPASIEQP